MPDFIKISKIGSISVLGIYFDESIEKAKKKLLFQNIAFQEEIVLCFVRLTAYVQPKDYLDLEIVLDFKDNLLYQVIIKEKEYRSSNSKKCWNYFSKIFQDFIVTSNENKKYTKYTLINAIHNVDFLQFSNRKVYARISTIGKPSYVYSKDGETLKQSQRNAFLKKCTNFKPNIKTTVCAILIMLMSFFIPIKGCEDKKKAEDVNYVYVCTGAYSKRYHSASNCRWLGSCKGEIVKMSKEEAEQKGLTPCKSCSKDQILK